ncbi:MAG: EAL domain-containing protein [Kordiimonadaceae bacterium]|nr:EAL domain-containing protein [Kordiimonadaceae bacterium]
MTGVLKELKKERERFVAFAFAAAEIFLEVGPDGQILYEGGAAERIGRNKNTPLVGQNINDILDPDDQQIYSALSHHLKHKGRIGPIPLRFMSEGNRSIALRAFALGMPGDNDRIFLALRAAPLGAGGFSDTNEETGLLSQDAFLALAAETMADKTNSNIYVTAVEVDGLKEAQEKFGPKYMRQLLAQVAAHLKTVSVDGQTAGQIGEKHFAFLHRTKADGQQLNASLQKLDKNISLKTTYSTVASGGSDVSEDQILRTLSYMLNKFCKNPGSMNFDTLSEAFEEMATETQRRVSEMHTMTETGNFKIAFQPVVSLQGGDIHHNEILSRFDDDGEQRSPLEVIKFAEDVGIIEEFDIALCKKAIDYVRKLKKLGTPLTLGVNLSGRTLDSGRFTSALVSTLKEARDISRSILLELTDTAAVGNLEQVEAILNDLKSVGYQICLGDFGAGAAGYQYLRSFNVDYVKISGSYVTEMTQDGYKPTFLLSMVKLCNDLNIKTIGGHVETKFQSDLLRSLGVDYAQGYYFGRPEFNPKTN